VLAISSSLINNFVILASKLNTKFCLLALSILLFGSNLSAKIYLTQNEFISQLKENHSVDITFDINISERTLWLNKTIQSKISQILDHKYPKLRIRYKTLGSQNNASELTTIWFLEEVGKERAISFAIAIKDKKIKKIQVLEFRESRGYEISIPTFAKQFDNLHLNSSGRLNKIIDGITGATMSVNAMKKISRLALMLDEYVNKSNTL